MNLPELLPYFDSWTRSGNGRFMGACPMPNHNDSDPSVAITQDAETGKILIFCWGCNTKAPALVQALGLTLSALQGDPGHPSAVRQQDQNAPITEKEQSDLELRVKAAVDNLHVAENYILTRFNLTIEAGRHLNLGVDDGFGVSHLIIPFVDPTGKIVAMQGRRLVDGDPRWRSITGAGWSKLGCFGWDNEGPVIITEGPSDALAVVGRANLPAIAIRGASNTSPEVCEKLKNWLGNRLALIVGDPGEAGENFTQGLHAGTGLPYWIPPNGDLCEFLATHPGTWMPLDEAERIIDEPTETRQDQSIRIADFYTTNFSSVCYDEPFKDEFRTLPNWQANDIHERVRTALMAAAPYGQRGDERRRVNAGITAFQQALRIAPHIPGGNAGGPGAGGGGGVHAPIPDEYDPTRLPEIVWNVEDQLHVTEFSIRNAMDDYSEGEYYHSATGLYVKIVGDELVNLKEPGVKSMLSSMAHWRVINGQRETGHVPSEAAKLISDPSWQCSLPEINRRVEVPFMLGDGEIVSEVGYHEDSGVYLLPRSNDRIIVPVVPSIITEDHIDQARQILEDATEGFMFKDQASKSNLIAMTLTSPLRELFRSNPMVPLLTSTAPQSGSGKGTSVRVPLSTCGVGPHTLSTTAYNPDENEFEKKLVGKLLKKSTYIFLDNIRATVSSSVMEQMLTAANYDGRTLGYSEVNSLSTLVMWVCTLQSTGAFNRDLTRRCVPVELIKNYKGKWKHKNIEAYLADKRGEMLWACFVVARKWLQDGGQISEARLDGYGGWTEVIGGILENVLGYEDFLGNLDGFRQSQDENGMTIDGVLERWLTLYGANPMPARMAIEDFEDPALHQLLHLHNPSNRQVTQALIRLLDSQRGYIVNSTHVWEPLGLLPFSHEGMLKQYQCIQLPTEEGEEV